MTKGQHSLWRWGIGWLLIVGLAGACAPATPEGVGQAPASSRPSVTAAPEPTATLVPPPPTSTPRPTPSPSPLVVLHTNDNWGETEPCG